MRAIAQCYLNHRRIAVLIWQKYIWLAWLRWKNFHAFSIKNNKTLQQENCFSSMRILPFFGIEWHRRCVQLGSRILGSVRIIERSWNSFITSIHHSFFQVWYFIKGRYQNAKKEPNQLHCLWSFTFHGHRHEWYFVWLGIGQIRTDRKRQKN